MMSLQAFLKSLLMLVTSIVLKLQLLLVCLVMQFIFARWRWLQIATKLLQKNRLYSFDFSIIALWVEQWLHNKPSLGGNDSHKKNQGLHLWAILV